MCCGFVFQLIYGMYISAPALNSGEHFELTYYVFSENFYNALRDIGTAQNPATSCKDIKTLQSNQTSGSYVIKNLFGQVSDQYCNMDLVGCGRVGGWMRVANLDMTQRNQACPPGFRTITASGKRLCGRPGPAGCVSVNFSTNNIPYSRVSGRVIAYQDKTPDAQCPYVGIHADNLIHTLDEVYIDGVSITYGSPRQHIWSFLASNNEGETDCTGCPCYTQFNGTRVPFIGDNFFCDSGTETWHGRILYHADPLWDGHGCGPNNGCCTFNNPPWFCTELDQHTSDDIELRLCANQDTDNEDTPIEIIELYVQ